MIKIQKILVGLLCLTMLFALCACGGDDTNSTESGKNAPVVSDTASGDAVAEKTGSNNTEKSGGDDKKSGGDIVLPEDGKIEFGKNNKKSEETTEASKTTGNTDKDSDKSEKDNTDKDSGNTSSEISKPEDITKPTESEISKPTESETSKPTDGGSSTGGDPANNGGWGNVQWN